MQQGLLLLRYGSHFGRGTLLSAGCTKSAGSNCLPACTRRRGSKLALPLDLSNRFGHSRLSVRHAQALAESVAAPASQAGQAAAKWSYITFAKTFPFANNLIIATCKTSAADLLVQAVIERKSFDEFDWKRNMVFCMFGCVYLGAFQYFYQINVFKRLFPGVDAFTSKPWAAKLTDVPGLLALGGQTALDLGMLTFAYLPTFYVFKGFVFGDTWDHMEWVNTGIGNYCKNWWKDVYDVCRVWGPADLVCFSVPLWLRLPVRHVVSFVWTAYLSFMRGSK